MTDSEADFFPLYSLATSKYSRYADNLSSHCTKHLLRREIYVTNDLNDRELTHSTDVEGVLTNETKYSSQFDKTKWDMESETGDEDGE